MSNFWDLTVGPFIGVIGGAAVSTTIMLSTRRSARRSSQDALAAQQRTFEAYVDEQRQQFTQLAAALRGETIRSVALAALDDYNANMAAMMHFGLASFVSIRRHSNRAMLAAAAMTAAGKEYRDFGERLFDAAAATDALCLQAIRLPNRLWYRSRADIQNAIGSILGEAVSWFAHPDRREETLADLNTATERAKEATSRLAQTKWTVRSILPLDIIQRPRE